MCIMGTYQPPGLSGRVPVSQSRPYATQCRPDYSTPLDISLCLFFWLGVYFSTEIIPLFILAFRLGKAET